MRKRFILAVIGGLVLPIAGLCAAADIAAIRDLAIVHSASEER